MGAHALTAIEKYEAERGRAWVQWYFSERGGTPGSPFEQFSGKGKHQRESRLKPSRRVDGLSPTRHYAVETERQGSAKIPISSGLTGGKVRRAIAQLPALAQNWVHHCYNPSHRSKTEAWRRLWPLIVEDYRASQPKGTRATTARAAEAMLQHQAYHAVSYFAFCHWDERKPVALNAKISDEQWRRTYRLQWHSARIYLVHLDDGAMKGIARQIG